MSDQNSVRYATALLVAGLLPRSLVFDPRPVRVGFLTGKLALCLLKLTSFHPSSIFIRSSTNDGK